MKRVFIVNPKSGKGYRSGYLAGLREYFTTHTGSFDYRMPMSREQSIEITRRELYNGAQQIVAVGGDGTVNAVVNGFFEDGKLINPAAALAVSRVGSGSDYFKTLVHGKKTTEWKEIVVSHQKKLVDVGLIHYASATYQDRYFVNIASSAINAEVVKKKDAGMRWIPNKLKYLLPTLVLALTYKSPRLKIGFDDDRTLEIQVLSLSIAKGMFMGAGMRMARKIKLNDGLFEVTVIQPLTLTTIFSKISRMYSGEFADIDEIKKFTTTTLTIESAAPIPIEFDGEVYGTPPVRFEVLKQVLPVCFPEM